MIIWRISNHESLVGIGGLRASGRWHTQGHRIVYCAPNPATALLEVLVHLEVDAEDIPDHFKYLKVDTDDIQIGDQVDETALPDDWRDHVDLTRQIGDEWLTSNRSALLVVPSVIVPETYNLLINPDHPDGSKLTIADTIGYPIDKRLANFLKGSES